MKKLFSLIAVIAVAVPAVAQNLRTSFLLDNYIFNYRLNPAAQNPDTLAFFGFGLDNISLDAYSTVGLGDVMYPKDGKLVLGFNKAVLAEEFLGSLNKNNAAGFDFSENLLAFGFWSKSKKSFSTVEINLRSNNYLNVPLDMMEFLKLGGNGGTYSFKDVELNSKSYVEFAYGLSKRIGDNFRVGARLKLLAGIASVDAYISKGDVRLGDESAEAKFDGHVNIAQEFCDITFDEEDGLSTSDIMIDGIPVSGFGAALDLGAEWDTPVDGLTLSASISDLGATNWKNSTSGTFKSDVTIDYTGEGSDDFGDMFSLEEATPKPTMSSLPTNLMLGAKYKMPFYKGLEVGLIATSHRSGSASWNEVRLGLGFNPGRVLSLAGSVATGTFGPSFGAAMSFRLKGLSLYVGADGLVSEVNPQYIPISAVNACVTAGLAISL